MMKALVLICGILIGIPLIVQCLTLQAELNSEDDICRLFPDGVVLRKPGSCKDTIICYNGETTPNSVTCAGNKIVKLDKMTCAVDSTDKYCTPVCTKTSPTFIEDIKNCNEWTECDGAKVVKSGSCPTGQMFNQEQQLCDYERDECKRTYHICNVAKTNQPFWDENNCHKYFLCNSKRELIEVKCPISTYYDARTGACTKKTYANCYKIPIPDQACGTKKKALLNHFISDQATCRGYFFCKDLGKSSDGNFIPDKSPNWGQCDGASAFFDERSQACQDMNYIKCDEDRCEGRNSGRILSEMSGCQHYLECKDGYTVDEVKCPDNKYFDPTAETCVDSPLWYPICN